MVKENKKQTNRAHKYTRTHTHAMTVTLLSGIERKSKLTFSNENIYCEFSLKYKNWTPVSVSGGEMFCCSCLRMMTELNLMRDKYFSMFSFSVTFCSVLFCLLNWVHQLISKILFHFFFFLVHGNFVAVFSFGLIDTHTHTHPSDRTETQKKSVTSRCWLLLVLFGRCSFHVGMCVSRSPCAFICLFGETSFKAKSFQLFLFPFRFKIHEFNAKQEQKAQNSWH